MLFHTLYAVGANTEFLTARIPRDRPNIWQRMKAKEFRWPQQPAKLGFIGKSPRGYD